MRNKKLSNNLVTEQQKIVLQALGCVGDGRQAIYLSGPITTGIRFFEWYRKYGNQISDQSKYATSLNVSVRLPNELEIKAAATKLRVQNSYNVIEPSSLSIDGWSQANYHSLWEMVIDRYVHTVILLPGWQYSAGCAVEFIRAVNRNLRITDPNGHAISPSSGLAMLADAARNISKYKVPIAGVKKAARALSLISSPRSHPATISMEISGFRKDASLDRLSEKINVAQFVSFSSGEKPTQQFSRVKGLKPNYRFKNLTDAVEQLLNRSADGSINIRSFRPDSPQSHEFIYGIRRADVAVSAINRLTGVENLYVIVNETIDVKDGGVSGVIHNGIIEFSPDDTPRCVEKPGVTSFDRHLGMNILSSVYGFVPDIDVPLSARLEFSLHPKKVGWRNTHTLGWEYQEVESLGQEAKLSWPTNFSRMIGDKAFGLLVAHHIGLMVPSTTVFNRRVAPFSFGSNTDTAETWLRTCPREQMPGRFTTTRGWIDPYLLMQREDPNGSQIVSVLAQQGVDAKYSGAAIVGSDGRLIVEGRAGYGDVLMLGDALPEKLPRSILQDVKSMYRYAESRLGPVRFEWVHSGKKIWIVQLHVGATMTSHSTLVPGAATSWEKFDPNLGLKELRVKIATVQPGTGISLTRDVGLTSHIADVIRKSKIPTRIERGN